MFKYSDQSPDGAHPAACLTMTPLHGQNIPQNTQPPVTLSLSDQIILQGQTVTLTIEGIDGFQFRGFLVQARTLAPAIIGTFLNTDGTRALACPTLAENTVVTHVNSQLKSSVQLVWQAPITSETVFPVIL